MGRARYTLKTNLLISISESCEHEPEAVIEYTVTPGAPDTRDEPGWDAHAEITSIKVKSSFGVLEDVPGWMFALFEDDRDLQTELLTDAADLEEAYRDQAADAKREEQMLERRS